ncbi:MAG: pyridoxal phosphate-dependent class II aminotransferase [Syntrophobacterales bacterium]|nr:pyridoxal phosphate-dependent class II aminotransferase [Syntrophobacterales bacterium]
MTNWNHGGNIYEISNILQCKPEEIIDLSASINPLGPPEGLRELICESFEKIRHYPDIRNKGLIEAISTFYNLPEDYIVVGNGSTEILYWIPYALALERAAIVVPTFSEYIRALENKGVILRTLVTSWENGFQPTVYQLEALIQSGSPEAVFLTNPGSPSGVPLSSEVREFVGENLGKSNIIWVIDEVFIDFCEEYSLLQLVKSSKNIAIIRSLTKFYALPGLRLGYLIAHPLLTKRLKSFIPPWSVNVLAQEAGVYCLSQKSFIEKTIRFFKEERDRIFGILKNNSSLDFLPSVANYILLRFEDNFPLTAYEVQNKLLSENKILIRNCDNFKGLSDRFIRVAIASQEVNNLWTEALNNLSLKLA